MSSTALPLRPVERGSQTPLYRQAITQLSELIADGTIAPGEPLPPSVQLEEQLDIPHHTYLRCRLALSRTGLIFFDQGHKRWCARKAAPVAEPDRATAARNRLRLLGALTQAQQAACMDPRSSVYAATSGEPRRCRCMPGLLPGPDHVAADASAVHTGCPELLQIITDLRMSHTALFPRASEWERPQR